MALSDQNVIHDYDKVWENWLTGSDIDEIVQQHLAKRQKFHQLLEDIVSGLAKGSKIIELGCGPAIDIGIISQKYFSHIFMATDLSRNAVRLALKVSRHFERPFHVFSSDILHLPLSPNSFDVVFSQGVMEHFKDPVPFFRAQIAVLKPGGYLIVNVPQKFTGYTLFKQDQIRKGIWKLGWETEFSYFRLKRIICDFGLTEVGHSGEGYWKSWQEPAFVLRDLLDKLYRVSPVRLQGPFRWPQKIYHRIWSFIEDRAGHLFMKNLIVVFKKSS
jgi:SAM-dependent methyltransferase